MSDPPQYGHLTAAHGTTQHGAPRSTGPPAGTVAGLIPKGVAIPEETASHNSLNEYKVEIRSHPQPVSIVLGLRDIAVNNLGIFSFSDRSCRATFDYMTHNTLPASPMGVTAASVPPASMMSACPARMCIAALMNA